MTKLNKIPDRHEDEQEDLPRFSYDLIALLDATVPHVRVPSNPTEVAQFRDNLDTWMHNAGRRSIVDELVAMLAAMEEPDDLEEERLANNSVQPNILDTPVLGSHGTIYRPPSPAQMDALEPTGVLDNQGEDEA